MTGRLLAGVGKRDITTDQEGAVIHDPLFAKALVLNDGSTQLAILALDALAIGGIGDIHDDFLPKLRQRIEQELGIPGKHVIVNASHTHPPGRLLCDDAEQVERTFDAVKQALHQMVEVKLGVGVGYEDRIMVNRNLELKDGKHWSIRYAHPCPPDEDVVGTGPVDPEIGVVRIDRLDGRPFAVVCNFACHPLIGVPEKAITANYPGVASRIIEAEASHGVMALFLQGAAGDIIEEHFKDVDRSRNAEPIGTLLGRSVLQTWQGIRMNLEEDAGAGASTSANGLKVISETVMFPRRTDIPERIAALQQEQAELLGTLRSTCLDIKTFIPLYLKYALSPDYPSGSAYQYLHADRIGSNELRYKDEENRRNIAKYMANIHVMERLVRVEEDLYTLRHHQMLNDQAGGRDLEAEIMGIRIGECVLITAPAEVLVEVGLRVKQTSPHKYTFMAAYTNGFMDYAAPEHHYEKGGYEVVECHLAPEWQGIYERVAGNILSRL